MSRPPEGTHFCPSCDAAINERAVFCEFCGHRVEPSLASLTPAVAAAPDRPSYRDLDSEPEPIDPADFESPEARELVREVRERHLSLVKRYLEHAAQMLRSADDAEAVLAGLAGEPASAKRTQQVHDVLTDLEAIGDEWEEVQHAYNRDSEELDDEIIDRSAELGLDVELTEQHRDDVNNRLMQLGEAFDRVSQRVQDLGDLGNGIIRQAQGRWFSSAPNSSSGGGWFAPIVGLLVVAGTVGVQFWKGVEGTEQLAIAATPAAAGAVLLLIGRFFRRR